MRTRFQTVSADLSAWWRVPLYRPSLTSPGRLFCDFLHASGVLSWRTASSPHPPAPTGMVPELGSCSPDTSLAESSNFRLRRIRPHELPPEVQVQLLHFALILVHDLEWQFPPVSASAYCKGGKVILHSDGTSQLWSIAQSTTFESASKSDYWRIQSQIRISKKLVTTLRILAGRLPVLQFTWFPHFPTHDLDPNVMLPRLIRL